MRNKMQSNSHPPGPMYTQQNPRNIYKTRTVHIRYAHLYKPGIYILLTQSRAPKPLIISERTSLGKKYFPHRDPPFLVSIASGSCSTPLLTKARSRRDNSPKKKPPNKRSSRAGLTNEFRSRNRLNFQRRPIWSGKRRKKSRRSRGHQSRCNLC